MRPWASPPSPRVDNLDTSDVAVGTKVVPTGDGTQAAESCLPRVGADRCDMDAARVTDDPRVATIVATSACRPLAGVWGST
jgi:hypothetical protein